MNDSYRKIESDSMNFIRNRGGWGVPCETVNKFCKENLIPKSTFYEYVAMYKIIPVFKSIKTINKRSTNTNYYKISDLNKIKEKYLMNNKNE